MPGRPSDTPSIQYIGAAIALVALVGAVVFDWDFGATDGIVPFAIGVGCVLLAVGWPLYQRG